jgi:hypothetical protein
MAKNCQNSKLNFLIFHPILMHCLKVKWLNFVYCPSITHKDDHTEIKKSYKETPSFGHFYTLLLISNIISMQYSFSDRGFQKEFIIKKKTH